MSIDLSNTTIAFLGAGNMSRSIIGGLVNDGLPPTNIIAANPSMGKLEALSQDFNVVVTQDNQRAVHDADIVVLAVKPQMMATLCEQIAPLGEQLKDKLFVSVAAGVTCERIAQLLGHDVPQVRCMPNTPSILGQGVSGLYNHGVDEHRAAMVEQIMKSTGMTVWVEQEAQIDCITAISGSGPAYFFLFMEAMAAKAEAFGFDPDTARQLVQQTAAGAAAMVADSDLPISQLRQNVTSKGGTTAAALNVFEQNGLTETVAQSMQAACDRAAELAKTL